VKSTIWAWTFRGSQGRGDAFGGRYGGYGALRRVYYWQIAMAMNDK
jgi:hypothetical protein